MKNNSIFIVCTPPPFYCCRRVEPPTKFSKKGEGLTGPQLLEGVGGKEGVNFSGGGCNFYIENKVKSEKINDKRSL